MKLIWPKRQECGDIFEGKKSSSQINRKKSVDWQTNVFTMQEKTREGKNMLQFLHTCKQNLGLIKFYITLPLMT
jgi:hypothetical protein